MIWTKDDIQELDQRYRGRFVNSLSGIKSANLIATKSKEGRSNLAIFSSVVHLGANPAMVGFVMRPTTVERHTYLNIIETGCYTINHIHEGIVRQAHQTSARYEDSEFEKCGLTEEYLNDYHAPAVAESSVKYGVRFSDLNNLANGCKFIIGDIEWVSFDESALADDGYLDLAQLGATGIVALDGYHSVSLLERLSYAKPDQELTAVQDWKKGWS